MEKRFFDAGFSCDTCQETCSIKHLAFSMDGELLVVTHCENCNADQELVPDIPAFIEMVKAEKQTMGRFSENDKNFLAALHITEE